MAEIEGAIYSASSCLKKSKDVYTSFQCNAENMDPKSITIGLSEDALVQRVAFHFYESFSARIENFKISLSLDGKDMNWIEAGVYTADQFQ